MPRRIQLTKKNSSLCDSITSRRRRSSCLECSSLLSIRGAASYPSTRARNGRGSITSLLHHDPAVRTYGDDRNYTGAIKGERLNGSYGRPHREKYVNTAWLCEQSEFHEKLYFETKHQELNNLKVAYTNIYCLLFLKQTATNEMVCPWSSFS